MRPSDFNRAVAGAADARGAGCLDEVVGIPGDGMSTFAVATCWTVAGGGGDGRGLENSGIPFTCHAGSSIAEKGSRSSAASANARTKCCVAAERFFRMSAALQARASSTVDFTNVSRTIANDVAPVCMAYLPSCCAFLINCERYCLSLAESLLSGISSRAATACSGDPPKKVFTMCFRALARTWRVSSAGR